MRKFTTSIFTAAALLLVAQPSVADWDAGVAAFRGGDYSAAAREFQSMVEQRTDCAVCYLMLGQSLLKLKRPQEAVNQLRKAYDLSPQDDGIRLPLAQAYLEAKRYDDAVQLLRTMNPDALPKEKQQVFFQMRAAALDRSGRSDEVITDLRAAARANPSDAAAQYQYGQACLAARESCAVPTLTTAVRLDPRDPDKKRSLVKAHLLDGRQAQGSAKIAAYRAAAQVGQELVNASANYENLMLLGESQLGAKQYREAAATFQRAVSANGNEWLPAYYLGQAQTANEQFTSAEATLKQALNLASTSRDQNRIWAQLGFVYEKKKSYDEAISAYRRIGDSGGVSRVEENRRIAEENQQAEQFNQQVEELERAKRELEAQMKDLPPSR